MSRRSDGAAKLSDTRQQPHRIGAFFDRLEDRVRRVIPVPRTIVVRTRGLSFEVDPRSEIGFALWTRGGVEDRENDLAAALFVSRFSGERCIVDVGANIGSHALAWATLCDRIIAIEPVPATAAKLRANVRRNGLSKRVTVLECALGEHAGDAAFHVTDDDAYSSLRDTRRKRVREVIHVDVRTLDEVAAEHRVGLVKIDVEGLESAVIAGGRRTIDRDRPLLVVEIYGGTSSNADPEGTVTQICELGYDAWVFTEATGLARYVRHDDAQYNYFFVPRR